MISNESEMTDCSFYVYLWQVCIAFDDLSRGDVFAPATRHIRYVLLSNSSNILNLRVFFYIDLFV